MGNSIYRTNNNGNEKREFDLATLLLLGHLYMVIKYTYSIIDSIQFPAFVRCLSYNIVVLDRFIFGVRVQELDISTESYAYLREHVYKHELIKGLFLVKWDHKIKQ